MLMHDFADRTGISDRQKPPRRYLWTDSFAVCNFLELFRLTGDESFKSLALTLVDQVHETLGRHRGDDSRHGWISGLNEDEGRKHPTAGGLRIGKALQERQPDEPFDERLEWERDGQYFHYLTKWMHALYRVGQVTGNDAFHFQARELAQAIHGRFTYWPGGRGPRRMYWKMSIDLSRPLVPSMGHHDPLDGLITYSELQATSTTAGPDLAAEMAEMAAMCRGKDWTTDDPLGLGGLMTDACRVTQMTVRGMIIMPGLLEDILSTALVGLESFLRRSPLTMPANYRLAFREFGLSLGLRALAKLKRLTNEAPLGTFANIAALTEQITAILHYAPIGKAIEAFWLDPANRQADTWTEHEDINAVMLATSLTPEGFLTI